MTNGHDRVRFRGVAFEFGDEVLIVPPLNTAELEEFAEQLDKVGQRGSYTMKTMATFLKANLVPMVASVMKRNYPDFDDTKAHEFVTAENWGALVGALLGNSTAPKVRVGEPFPAVMPGSPAVSTPSSPTLTGDSSAPASPVEPDGLMPSSLKM